MDNKLKRSGLESLAKAGGEAAEAVLKKEFARISAALKSETEYESIADKLDLLDIIAYRVYEDAVTTIRELLKRLEGQELTHQEYEEFYAVQLSKYHNKYALMVKALEVLEHIRYHMPSEILDIFFEYSSYKKENVAKQAKHGIEKFSEYNLDIFYGNDMGWPGLGWGPQENVLEKIRSFDNNQKKKYFFAITMACKKILSPTITGTSSTYNTFTWRTGAVPAAGGMSEIRVKALNVLQDLFLLAENLDQKVNILQAMEEATRFPHAGKYGDDVKTMIVNNSKLVAEFMKVNAVSDDLQFMQKIEHDAYWLFYHLGTLDAAISKITLETRDLLYADEEYQKFRVLIGYESIFHDWDKMQRESEDFKEEDKLRESEALRLAESINAKSYDEWKHRIIRYASIESNDLATFPFFGKFLEHFGKISPVLAVRLLSEDLDKEKLIVALLCGIEKAGHKKAVYKMMNTWCDEGKYLLSQARFFEYSLEVNEELLKKILDKAIASNDINALCQIIYSVTSHYDDKHKKLIKDFFIPALDNLTSSKKTNWIFGFWFRKQRSDILSGMDVAEKDSVLNNLSWLHEIDYHAEEILYVIAKQSPELVIQFFRDRLLREKEQEGEERYEAVPFSFHKLSEPLSKVPEQAIKAMLDIYDGDYGLFIHRGAHLLKNIFPNFPKEFQQKLLEVAKSNEDKVIHFVMAILRNYDGNAVIHDVCKELVKVLPEGSDFEVELRIILSSTGVVSGEYGFVEAYTQKIIAIQSWLKDDNAKVRKFAQNYISDLEKSIEHERKRVDEDITLRKHRYGSDED